MLKQIQSYQSQPESTAGYRRAVTSLQLKYLICLRKVWLQWRTRGLWEGIPWIQMPGFLKGSSSCSSFQNEALRNSSAGAIQKESSGQKNAPKMGPLGTLQFLWDWDGKEPRCAQPDSEPKVFQDLVHKCGWFMPELDCLKQTSGLNQAPPSLFSGHRKVRILSCWTWVFKVGKVWFILSWKHLLLSAW